MCVFSILSLAHFKENLGERKESGHSNHVWEESKIKAQQIDHQLFILYAAAQVLHLYKRDSEVQCVLSFLSFFFLIIPSTAHDDVAEVNTSYSSSP